MNPPDDHNCVEEECEGDVHYGLSWPLGLCLVCGGCGDPECCGHEVECFPHGAGDCDLAYCRAHGEDEEM